MLPAADQRQLPVVLTSSGRKRGCPQPNDVGFMGCGQLTDISVVALAERCPQLTNVYNFRLVSTANGQ